MSDGRRGYRASGGRRGLLALGLTAAVALAAPAYAELPAFGMMGKGISELVRARQINPPAGNQQLPYVAPPESLPSSKTSQLRPPVPSVTEGTTRHLGAEAPTRHFDPWDDQKPS